MLYRRAKAGLCSYGEHLKPFNKRCSLIDSIEESADMLCYLLNMAQESRHLLIDLMANSVRLREAGHTAAADGLDKIIVGMGGKETLAQYDEILGTVAETATVVTDAKPCSDCRGMLTTEPKCCQCNERDAIRAELAAAKNLLARIHRDGGHHTEAVGLTQSVADAEDKVSEWLLVESDRIEQEASK